MLLVALHLHRKIQRLQRVIYRLDVLFLREIGLGIDLVE